MEHFRGPGVEADWPAGDPAWTEDGSMVAVLGMWLMMAGMSVGHPEPRGPRPPAECKSAYGVTECGYGCVAAYGKVKCAQTPEGRCEAAYGEITCWDPRDDGPPRRERGERGGWRGAPGATCESAYGKTACGFSCVAAYGEVKCAETAMGVCKSAYGQVVCWDPPRRVVREYGGTGPKAMCEASYGKIGCGYGCVASYGQVGCASAPDGACEAAYGKVTCSR